ncbi:hypothetical protein AVEN_72527-1 [Araneus ventricosus]|uniref:Uncharacterized protein n=1 Tax=Araneus ventricosus TaxID=182803 RepID=A0A4Y2TY74_ARAVE|nr:hypothetical protein AVEN_72527-1 [Araneus ventricosus]
MFKTSFHQRFTVQVCLLRDKYLDSPNVDLFSLEADTLARSSGRRVPASTSHGRRFKTLFHQRSTMPTKSDGVDSPNRYLFSHEADTVARSSDRRVLPLHHMVEG